MNPLLLIGLLVVGLVGAAVGAGGVVVVPAWVAKVIARVSKHEGKYDSMNRNLDGAGLSFGIIQWAQAPGSLGTLLLAMKNADPATFASVFGGPELSEQLLATCLRRSLAPVGGAVLWEEPWVSRFRTAGRTPVFQRVQDALVVEGEHWKGAVAVGRFTGIMTERSMALFFDTAVQQGPARALNIAREVLDGFRAAGRASVTEHEVLEAYAVRCASQFRRTTAPTRPYPSKHIAWKQTGREWHAWAGRWDLYADITRRRQGILRDPGLGDAPVAL